MLNQVGTNKVRQQRGSLQEKDNTLRVHEFLKMNPPRFTNSSTTDDPKNIVEELNKMFYVIHVVRTERVELVSYQMKSVSRTLFDQWKDGKVEVHHIQVGLASKNPSWGGFFLES